MTLPMNTSLNVTVSLGVSGGAAETVGNAPPDTEAAATDADVVAVGIGARGLEEADDATTAAAAAAALLLVFLRMVLLFLGRTGAVKHWALGWR
jgi:hypothetical protein